MMSKSRKHEGQSDCLSASDVPSAVEPIRVSALLLRQRNTSASFGLTLSG